ncbi:MAG: hypothetical protein RBU25_08610 [Lentisphaeria bacterium]|jgi:hypothetical protein|nr:hypothetical protein [Lentisphaeria bacterium]
MLNLVPIFDDAIHSLAEYGSFLAIPPLPATVFMMQRDVINHYRYALTHYLPLRLSESFLQNSSIGTPYEKWARFTNDDFAMLSFAVTNLLRYTSRLIHETEATGLGAAEHYSEMKERGSTYIAPLVEIAQKGQSIGVRVNDNGTLSVTPFATDPDSEGTVRLKSSYGGATERVHVTKSPDGEECRRSITEEEYGELSRVLRPRVVSIQDRAVLDAIKSDGLREVEALVPLNSRFGELCNAYCSRHVVAEAFDRMNEPWWV